MSKQTRGAACLVLAFAAIFSFGSFAMSERAHEKSTRRHLRRRPPRTSSWSSGTIVTRTPAILTGIYAGLLAGSGWGRTEQDYERNDNHGLASTSAS